MTFSQVFYSSVLPFSFGKSRLTSVFKTYVREFFLLKLFAERMQVPSDELPKEGAALLPWGTLLQGWAFMVFRTVASLSLLIEFSVGLRASVLPLWPRWGKEPSQ